jgi:hypothetical protein
MRVVTVLLALVATPFVMGVSQTGSGLPGRSSCVNGQSGAHRSAQGTASAHQGLCAVQDPPPPPPPPTVVDSDGDGVPDSLDQCPGTAPGTPVDATGCPVQPPSPPPSSGCVATGPLGLGSSSIDGQVFQDASPWPGLANWCVQLTELNGAVSATAVTDAAGNYMFSGLPDGTYLVCEVLQSGWVETFPSSGAACANTIGWSFTLSSGGSASFIYFGNLPTP